MIEWLIVVYRVWCKSGHGKSSACKALSQVWYVKAFLHLQTLQAETQLMHTSVIPKTPEKFVKVKVEMIDSSPEPVPDASVLQLKYSYRGLSILVNGCDSSYMGL